MGTNVAGLLQKAVKLLQDCSTRQTDSAEAQAALHSLQEINGKLHDLPTPAKAVWKKLVHQLQVCCTPKYLTSQSCCCGCSCPPNFACGRHIRNINHQVSFYMDGPGP